ncbi:MAG: SCO family protein [Balneolaceae bacterium]|nr:SCO family protein [Balneolaceae bacterium]
MSLLHLLPSDARRLLPFLVLLFAGGVLSSCDAPPVIHDLEGQSYGLVDQDSSGVSFPGDFSGQIVVLGYIYTHCPDVCPVITANMSNIRRQLEDTTGVHFVGISFDPERDTPSALARYMDSFELDPAHFTFVTGDTATVDSLLSAMKILARKSYPDSTRTGSYLMQHTNRIAVMDRRGRVRFEYPGSVVPPQNVIEDINKLR